jgi:hypothetical protein
MYAHGADLIATDVTVVDAGSHGVHADRGSLDAVRVTVDGAFGHGLYTYHGDLSATESTIQNVSNVGCQSLYGDSALDAVSITATMNHAVYVNRGSLVASDVTITDAGGRGVLATDAKAVVLDYVAIDGTNSHGIDLQGADLSPSHITNCTVAGADGHGIYTTRGAMISHTEVTGSTTNGIHINSAEPTTIDRVAVSDSGGYGILANRFSSQMEVWSSNVVDNSNYGVAHAKLLSGSYAFGNRDQDSADMPSDGDGTAGNFNTSTAQILNVDQVDGARATAVADAKPSAK